MIILTSRIKAKDDLYMINKIVDDLLFRKFI